MNSDHFIPLHARDGSVRTVTAIDADDLHLVVGYRWYLTATGYAGCNTYTPDKPCQRVLLHRVILGLVPGDGIQADHIDGDRLNNRRANLRPATVALNAQNREEEAAAVAAEWRRRHMPFAVEDQKAPAALPRSRAMTQRSGDSREHR